MSQARVSPSLLHRQTHDGELTWSPGLEGYKEQTVNVKRKAEAPEGHFYLGWTQQAPWSQMNTTCHRLLNSLITSPQYRPPGRAVQPRQAFSSACLCLRVLLPWAGLCRWMPFSCEPLPPCHKPEWVSSTTTLLLLVELGSPLSLFPGSF